ncbi:acyltransferase domain-containing protein, partial [Streptomyces cellulosae]
MRLLTEARPWRETGRPRRAGVSSFGISGTNAHVIVEEGDPDPAPDSAVRPDRTASPVPWLVSGRDEVALREQALRLREHVAGRVDADPVDVGFSLATTRAAHEHRAAVVGSTREELLAGLDALVRGDRAPEVLRGGVLRKGRTAFLLTGQGSQRLGMGRELYETFPAFAATLDAVCRHLDPTLPRPLKRVLFAPEGSADSALLDQTAFTQAALFAVETALYRLLEHHGVVPDYLIGHSIGEVTAAHLSGVWELADACAVVAARGRLMQAAREGGAMVALEASDDEVREALPAYGDTVAVAGVNGPRSTVVSGDAEAVDDLARLWRSRGRKTKRLPVSHAFHSPHMDDVLEEFRAALKEVTFHEPRIPVVSNITGELATPDELRSPAYWARHIREAVRFLDGVRFLETAGVTEWLELGPDGVLTAMAQECLTQDTATLTPLLRATRPETLTFATALARTHLNGGTADWTAVFPGGRRIELPTYAFRRDRYWLTSATRDADAAGLGLSAADHPLLGAAVPVADRDTYLLTGRLSLATHPWLADHALHGVVVFPGTGLLELAVRAGEEAGCQAVEQLTLAAPLVVPERGGAQVQVVVGEPDPNGRRRLEIYARQNGADDSDRSWTTCATGLVAQETAPVSAPDGLLVWPPADAVEVELDDAYARLDAAGYAYGPAFQGLRRLWRGDGELYAEVALSEEQRAEASGFALHPALLDAALHALLPGVADEDRPAVVPFAWEGARVHAVGATVLRVRLAVSGAESVTLTAADGAGAPVASVDSLVLRPLSQDAVRDAATAAQDVRDGLLRMEWIPLPDAGGQDSAEWTTLGDGDALPDLTELSGDVPDTVVVRLPSASAAGAAVSDVLALVRGWLAQERFAGSRLVVVTRGAVAVGAEDVSDVALAGVWGLLRSAQTENPGRFGLIDLEVRGDLPAAAVACGEPQLAVRGGRLLVPRLAAFAVPARTEVPSWGAGTVLVTGALGALGGVLVRHLVSGYGVRRLLLLSRRGEGAPGAGELRAELEGLGARVSFAACDAADRVALARVLERVPAEFPL